MDAAAHRQRHQRHPPLRLGDAGHPTRRHPRRARPRTRRPADPPPPLHRPDVVLPLLEPAPGAAGPPDSRRHVQMAHRRRSSTCQADLRPGRRTGHPLALLAPLEHHGLARLRLHRRGHRLPASTLRSPRRASRPGRHRHPRTAPPTARRRHPRPTTGPRAPSDLVHLAATAPISSAPLPPAMAYLRRDNTMITTIYGCRISSARNWVTFLDVMDVPRSAWIVPGAAPPFLMMAFSMNCWASSPFSVGQISQWIT